ncbi:MAG TPA: hypothetical protein P5244_04290 [Syntrophales bacterium]|nr:hypothetical protein [Syntrophales bacterium]
MSTMKRYIIRLNTDEDQDIIAMIDGVPKPHRGLFIREALRLGIDREKDRDICEGLPSLAKSYCRFDLVKEALRLYISTRHGLKEVNKAAATQANYEDGAFIVGR